MPSSGSGFVLADAFCRASGLNVNELDELVKSGRVDGGYSNHEVTGIFENSLPTREQLSAWGYSVPASYSPDALRTSELPAGGSASDPSVDEPPSPVIRW
jgi:hypothetical protein